jgi:serine/threonine protein kinase
MRLSHRSQQADEPGTNRVAIMQVLSLRHAPTLTASSLVQLCVLWVLQEIDVMLDLDHPNIVRLKEYYVERGRVYLIMELMQGGELLDALREKVRFGSKMGPSPAALHWPLLCLANQPNSQDVSALHHCRGTTARAMHAPSFASW